jgi:hypothetical protein
MASATSGANDLHVGSPEERRPARTIKVFIFLGWLSETTFLFFGMIVFPQLHPSLLGRLIWTQILCGIGMGAAAGAIAYLTASSFKQGSRAALIITALAGATVLAVCNTVCFFVDTRPGMDYWGSHENPALFLTKGYIASILGGLVGSWLLNTKKGVTVLDKIPFLR